LTLPGSKRAAPNLLNASLATIRPEKCPICGGLFQTPSGRCNRCDNHRDSQAVSIAEHEPENRITIRDSLAGRSIQIRKGVIDGKWKAYLFPNGDNILEAESADDPAAAIIRLARKIQELPK